MARTSIQALYDIFFGSQYNNFKCILNQAYKAPSAADIGTALNAYVGVKPVNFTGAFNDGKIIGFTTVTTTKTGNLGILIDSPWISIAGGSTFGAKLMFNNTAATVLYGLGLRCRTGLADGIAVGLNVSASTNIANSGGIQAIQGYAQVLADKNVRGDSTDYVVALYGKTICEAAVATAAMALWIDEGSTTKATKHWLANLTLNGGAIAIDAIFHIYAGTMTSALLFDLEGSCGVSAGSTKSTPGTVDKWLDINIDSVAHYIPCYASKTT